jgi:hypothetical protein
MKQSLLLLLPIAIFYFDASAQDEQFSGQSKLANCEVMMNISGRWKDSLANKTFAESLKDVELVWIYIDKRTRKTKVPDPQRVYLVNELLPTGKRVTYLVPSEIYKTHSQIRSAIFPTWSASKSNKYYKAECYDSAMKN